jgi:chromosome partitioning protein
MPQVIAFINMKGGVGKTTLAVNVAHGLASIHRKKVLIVDADPQFNATQYLLDDDVYLEHINDQRKGTIREIFVPRRPGPVNTVVGVSRQTNKTRMPLKNCTCNIFDGGGGRGKLDLIPSTLGLMDIETSKRGTENKLNAYLKEKAGGYDYILIDCPPTISIFTQAAILASDKYLVPIKPDPLSVIGLPLLERWLEEYTDDAGKDITTVGLVFTLVRGPLPNRMRQVMDELRQQRGGDVFQGHLSQAAAVAQSVEAHQPIFRFKPGAKSAGQILHITEEFLGRTSGE